MEPKYPRKNCYFSKADISYVETLAARLAEDQDLNPDRSFSLALRLIIAQHRAATETEDLPLRLASEMLVAMRVASLPQGGSDGA